MQTNVVDATTEKREMSEAMQRGIAAAEAGDKATAHDIFRQLASTYPSDADVWVWLGGTSQDLDESELAFSRAQSMEPSNEEAALGLRWVALRRQANAHSTAPLAATELSAYRAATGTAVPAPETASSLAEATAAASSSDLEALSEQAKEPAADAAPVKQSALAARRRGFLSMNPGKALIVLAIICYLIIFVWLLTSMPH